MDRLPEMVLCVEGLLLELTAGIHWHRNSSVGEWLLLGQSAEIHWLSQMGLRVESEGSGLLFGGFLPQLPN